MISLSNFFFIIFRALCVVLLKWCSILSLRILLFLFFLLISEMWLLLSIVVQIPYQRIHLSTSNSHFFHHYFHCVNQGVKLYLRRRRRLFLNSNFILRFLWFYFGHFDKKISFHTYIIALHFFQSYRISFPKSICHVWIGGMGIMEEA